MCVYSSTYFLIWQYSIQLDRLFYESVNPKVREWRSMCVYSSTYFLIWQYSIQLDRLFYESVSPKVREW